MSEYKNNLLRQLGIKESSLKPSSILPTDAELNEVEDPNAEGDDYFARLKKDGQSNKLPKFESLISPTIASPVIAIGVRGSSTGGLPSGADRNMTARHVDGINVSKLTRGQLGGYEAIPTDRANSEMINKTPNNPQINSSSPKTDNPQTMIDPHPHQIQQSQGEAPQNVTGASTDSDSTLKLGMAVPKGIDIDVAENGNEQDKGEQQQDMEKQKQDQGSMGMNETFKRHLKLMKECIADRNLVNEGGICGSCNGSGEGMADGTKCDTCGGSGDSEKHWGKKKHDEDPDDAYERLRDKRDGLDEGKCSCGSNCTCGDDCKCRGGVKECATCGCGKMNTTHDMKEKVDEVNYTKDSSGKDVIAVGAPGSQARWETENPDKCYKCKGKKPCKCGKEEVKEVYSAPFEKMRGLANLGERRVGKTGLWENKNVGASEPFVTKWKMDKEKAGMVKVDEKKLETIKESLLKKKTLSLKESRLLELAKKLADKKHGK